MIAKKLDGKNQFNCIKVYVSRKAIGWEWFITDYDSETGIYECFVQSPLCLDGEFGSVMKSELMSIGAISELPECCMPPEGWGWE